MCLIIIGPIKTSVEYKSEMFNSYFFNQIMLNRFYEKRKTEYIIDYQNV